MKKIEMIIKNIKMKGNKALCKFKKSEKVTKLLRVIASVIFVFNATTINVFAAAPVAGPTVQTLTTTLSTYIKTAGGLVAFVGAIMTIAGYRSEDPGEQAKGIKTFISGLGVIAVATGISSFIA